MRNIENVDIIKALRKKIEKEKEIEKAEAPLAEEKTFEAKMEMLKMAKENFRAIKS